MTEKSCIGCKQTLPVGSFYISRGKPHGRCKVCFQQQTRKYLEDPANLAKKKANDRAYQAAHREERRKRSQKNAQRIKELRRAHYLRNRDHERACNKEWHAKNPGRAREIHRKAKRAYEARKSGNGGDGFTVDQWLDVVDSFGGCCAYCLKPIERITMDHFRPIKRGGRHDLDNVVPACQSCNSSKHDALIFAWLPHFEELGIIGTGRGT